MSFELRPYQVECVSRIIDAYSKNRSGREVVVMATGLGKTVVFAHVIAELRKRYNLNALIIAHRDELLEQARSKYLQVDPFAVVGKVGGGVHDYGGEVTVGSISTLCRPKHLRHIKALGYGLIIIDECHHSAAASYQRVLEALPEAFVLGVTATPDRLDKKDILGDKPPIFEAHIIDKIKEGYLANLRTYAIQTDEQIDDVRSMAGDFQVDELSRAVNTPARNALIVSKYKEYSSGKRALAFCVKIEHARNLCEVFNREGVPSAVVTGDTPHDERAKLYDALRRGEIFVLCNVNVLTEGFDLPEVECVIMARPTKSRALYMQCLGRGTRLTEQKQECVILDITDNCTRHRIKPVQLQKVLDVDMKDGEDLLESLDRIEEEAKVREHKLREQRSRDIKINLLADSVEWERTKSGAERIVVGAYQDRISLFPAANQPGKFIVLAKMQPYDENPQVWSNALPYSLARSFAERQAKAILAGFRKGLDRNNKAYRSLRASEAQIACLRKAGYDVDDDIARGKASDMISELILPREYRRYG